MDLPTLGVVRNSIKQIKCFAHTHKHLHIRLLRKKSSHFTRQVECGFKQRDRERVGGADIGMHIIAQPPRISWFYLGLRLPRPSGRNDESYYHIFGLAGRCAKMAKATASRKICIWQWGRVEALWNRMRVGGSKWNGNVGFIFVGTIFAANMLSRKLSLNRYCSHMYFLWASSKWLIM